MKTLLGKMQARYEVISDMAINSSGKSTIANHVVRDFMFEDKYWDDATSSYDNSMLKSWYADITTALSAIDGDNSLTAEQKTAYKNRIHLEGLTIRYLAVKLFKGFTVTSVSGSTISTDSMSQIITDAKTLGILRCAEGSFYYVKPDGVAGWFDKDSLKDGGMLAFEVGINEAKAVKSCLLDNGFAKITITKDLNGIDRVVAAIKE
jgi:hypothetical protein